MIRGALFSRFFLDDGIRETDAYRALTSATVAAFADKVRADWASLSSMAKPSEAETEGVFIYPTLDALGWTHLPQQTPGRGRSDIADALLFATPQDRAAAMTMPAATRFQRGAVVVENEARTTALDRASGKGEAPSSQILRYLIAADAQSNGAVRWGLLTNGRSWRLYWSQAPSRAEGFVEFDLPALVEGMAPAAPKDAPADHWLRAFLLIFGRDAVVPATAGAGGTFLDLALAEGRRYEARATAALSEAVFDRVFPALVDAMARNDPVARLNDAAWRAEAREAALRLLFRLLFLLYAEDRELLPVRHPGYQPYSLRALRDEAAEVVDTRRALSARAATWWPKLRELFRAIAEGDPTMGLPPYNGGLFHDPPGGLLTRLSLPDAVLVPLVDDVSRQGGGGFVRRYINYRDLSVQHLGGIYERLLERDPVPDGKGGLALRPNAFARKTTGSYYTPDELVRLILRRTVGPLLDERRAAFAARVEALAGDNRAVAARLADLAALDPAERFLDLKVADIAMGSGHFLVTLVDHLADATLAAVAAAPAAVEWGEYRSPLMARIEAMRAAIKAQATANGWPVREEHLDDRHIVRRIILKRCIYGVDMNPMAVELAKLSLWLHSFTVGAPLSFLDHHLRCGDSLFGEFVRQAEDDLRDSYGLVTTGAVAAASAAAAGMLRIEALADADVAEVKASADAFDTVENATANLRALLDLHHAKRWLAPGSRAEEAGRGQLFGGQYGDVETIARGGPMRAPRSDAPAIPTKGGARHRQAPIPAADAYAAAVDFVARARALAAERTFLHWEPAFPGVWDDWHRQRPAGGFHAVIGNPPWDRMKMQEVEWFAARVPAVAGATRAADRKRAVEALRKAGDPVAADYDRATWTAEAAARVARDCGAYPLLSGGDVNVYSLMVERAARLVRLDGAVGLLVPSGIAGDLGAAPFFRGIAGTGRLAALLDFENRRTRHKLEPFFPDVDSRFKFAAIVFGGEARTYPEAACAFFQQDGAEAEANAFPLTPADFAAVNPNTGTAPVFRSRRDAEITKAIYARLPVLVDRRDPKRPAAVWPVRYATMLHMTNDSAKFRTAAELRALGAYEVPGGGWEKGEVTWGPLYEGKMVQAFDHRAASVLVNSANVHRPAQPEATTPMQRADANWRPVPQFFVSRADVDIPADLPAVLAFKDITSPTNVRTMIAALIPPAAAGNTLPILLPRDPGHAAAYRSFTPLLVANLNAMVLDYVVRQKVQGTHVNSYIVEQLPVIAPTGYDRTFGPTTAKAIVRAEVLALTHTAHDMDAFARDQGHAGPPTQWGAEDRLRRRARLDAVFFHLYGLDRDEAGYVMDTFPIVRAAEIEQWDRYRTRELVLNTMAALAAGQPDRAVAG